MKKDDQFCSVHNKQFKDCPDDGPHLFVHPKSPAWVLLARAVSVAEESQYDGGAVARAALQSLIRECRRVIRVAQQESEHRPGDCGNPDCCNIGMDGPCPECRKEI